MRSPSGPIRFLPVPFSDNLTGLANRPLFHDRLAGALAHGAGAGGDVAVLYLDLDDFKPINDRHGHRAGDEVLREVGQRIVGCVRATDTVSRLGGDEFAVILNDPVPRDVPALAQRLIDAVGAPYRVDGVTLTVGVSIGLAVERPGGLDADHILGLADAAMYHAKKNGKNSYHLHAAVTS